MALHNKVLRHFLIIRKVREQGFPGFRDIKEMLEDHGFSLSGRTLQRDIENIRGDFGIEIRYNSYHNGYDIDHEHSVDMGSLMKFLELAVITSNFNEMYKNPDQARTFISFDSEDAVRGVEFISRILFALKNWREVNITYQRFIDEAPFQVKVKPGLLKEYQNRWYLIGIHSAKGEVRNYALDRMKNLEVGVSQFRGNEIEGIRERYDHVVGISGSNLDPMLIKLTVSPDQSAYMETLPWHPTQEVESETEKGTVFSLFVAPNYELIKLVLGEGGHILHIEPESFRNSVDEARKRQDTT